MNGLDEVYGPLHSQLLMRQPLPIVEEAFAVIQQEESPIALLPTLEIEHMAMTSKGPSEGKFNGQNTCKACGGRGHMSDKCWSVFGYPKWHFKYRPSCVRNNVPPVHNKAGGNKPKPQRMANNAIQTPQPSQDVAFTPQQLEQLLKLLPYNALQSLKCTESDEELDNILSRMVSSNVAVKEHKPWIVDSGASDHMTSSVDLLTNIKIAAGGFTISLPTGDVSSITHVGDAQLKCGLLLKNVLVVPKFKHNLLSIHKLLKDNKCDVKFTPQTCEITHSETAKLQATGHLQQGLYYLVDNKDQGISHQCNSVSAASETWHLRLGHAVMPTIQRIPHTKVLKTQTNQVCITCSMAKFAKLPYTLSQSYAASVFDLVHIDTWGLYRVNTREHYKYFLTLVDDHS